LKPLRRDELDEAQRGLFDAIVTSSRGLDTTHGRLVTDDGGLRGPFNAMLLQPALGHLLQDIGATLRYRGLASDRVREMSVLLVAAHYGCEYERKVHEVAARKADVPASVLATIRAGLVPELEDEAERLALEVVAALLTEHVVEDELYRRAVKALSTAVVFELSVIVGYYALLALQLPLFGVTP
jgi:4-carboxymuconolactone decarboxylase